MKKLIYAFTFIFLLSLIQSVFADNSGINYVEKTLKNKVDAVILLIRNAKLDKQSRDKQIIQIVQPLFNFELMSKLSLGKNNWIKFTPAQRENFVNLFTDRLKKSFLEKLELYTDESVQYHAAISINSKKIEMLTQLVSKSKSEPINMLYKLTKSKQNLWVVYDLEIMGVSLVQTYRSQFEAVLKKGSPAELLKKMGEKNSFKPSQK